MKKVTIAILAFLYLGLTTGVVRNLHYCMGQLSKVDFGYVKHDACDKCGMTEKDGCCSTELKFVKLQDSHQWEHAGPVKKAVFLPILHEHLLEYSAERYERPVPFQYHHSPPDHRANYLYLHTGTLLI